MGSFFSRCALSDLVITDHTPCRVVFLYENTHFDARSPTGTTRPTNYWVPLTCGVPGTYADYGQVEVDEDSDQAKRALFLLKRVVALFKDTEGLMAAQKHLMHIRGDTPWPQLKNIGLGSPKIGFCTVREDIWQGVLALDEGRTAVRIKTAMELRLRLARMPLSTEAIQERFNFQHETEFQRVFICHQIYRGVEKLDQLFMYDDELDNEDMLLWEQDITELACIHDMMESLGRAWLPPQSHTASQGLEQAEQMAKLVLTAAARERWRYEHGDGDYPEDFDEEDWEEFRASGSPLPPGFS